MDDSELDLSSFFLNDLSKESHHHACSHTHTCNPPGPDLSHTHTCFHVHTQILSTPSADEATPESGDKSSSNTSKKRSSGNREAVKKYRDKKKAHAASLEDEVVQLRALNQQLMKKLQGQAALEAEVLRLRCLLVDIRGRIEGEIGTFPYQKPVSASPNLMIGGAQVMNSCDLRCEDHCLGMQGKGVGDSGGAGVNGAGFGMCEMGNVQCSGNLGSQSEFLVCGRESMMPPPIVGDMKGADADKES